MMSFRSFTQHALTLLLALSICACLSDSANDSAAISLTITSPSSASTIDTVDTAVSLAGSASSAEGIARVAWVNDRGGEGVANGTTSWQTASIGLELGQNRITVTAEDTTGAITSRSISINRESGLIGSANLSWAAPTAPYRRLRPDQSGRLQDLLRPDIGHLRLSNRYQQSGDFDISC